MPVFGKIRRAETAAGRVKLATKLNFCGSALPPPDFPAAGVNHIPINNRQIICTMDESVVWQATRKPGRQRRKRSLSNHQKQIRFFTVLVMVLVLAAFTGLIFWLNL